LATLTWQEVFECQQEVATLLRTLSASLPAAEAARVVASVDCSFGALLSNASDREWNLAEEKTASLVQHGEQSSRGEGEGEDAGSGQEAAGAGGGDGDEAQGGDARGPRAARPSSSRAHESRARLTASAGAVEAISDDGEGPSAERRRRLWGRGQQYCAEQRRHRGGKKHRKRH